MSADLRYGKRINTDVFEHRWVCQVVRTGYHNGAGCNPGEDHHIDWGCGWRWEASLTDGEWNRRVGKPE